MGRPLIFLAHWQRKRKLLPQWHAAQRCPRFSGYPVFGGVMISRTFAAGLLILGLVSSAQAQTVPDDVRCLLLSNMFAKQGGNERGRQVAAQSLLFFAGGSMPELIRRRSPPQCAPNARQLMRKPHQPGCPPARSGCSARNRCCRQPAGQLHLPNNRRRPPVQIWMGLPRTAIAASLTASECVGWAWQV